MRRLWLALPLVIAGCHAAHVPESKPMQAAHFSPALPPPPTPEPPRVFEPMNVDGMPQMTNVNAGSSMLLAEIFPVKTSGQLSTLAFSIFEASRSDGDLWVEIRSASGGMPTPLSTPPLGTLQIPHGTMPSYTNHDNESTQLTYFDVSSLGIWVKNGDTLALVFRPAPGPDHLPHGDYMIKTVAGNVFPEGRAVHRYLNNYSDSPAWMRSGHNVVFQAYVDPAAEGEGKKGPTTLTASSPQSRPKGQRIAEALALPASKFIPKPSTQPARVIQQPPQPEIECRGTVFEQEGKWYLELCVYNGSWMPRAVPREPISITLVREGGGGSYLAYPLPPSTRPAVLNPYYGIYSRGSYGETATVEPAQGFIRQFQIRDAKAPLPPGQYRTVVVYNPQLLSKTVEIPFSIPADKSK